jgi:hypothetical protein
MVVVWFPIVGAAPSYLCLLLLNPPDFDDKGKEVLGGIIKSNLSQIPQNPLQYQLLVYPFKNILSKQEGSTVIRNLQ